MTVRDVAKLFPILVSIFDATKFADTLAMILSWAAQDPRFLRVPRTKHSRGFWNTVAMASLTTDDTVLAALWRLSIIEAGLEQAARVKKHKKFRASLAQDEKGFDQVIAELFCIGALGSAFAALDLERPGSKEGKNYDIRIEIDGEVVQSDVKWRTETPLGDGPPGLLKDLGDLLAKDVTCTAYVVLKTKTLSGEDRVRIGCMIVDCMGVEQGKLLGPAIDRATISRLPEGLLNCALHLEFRGEIFHQVVVGGVDALYIPSQRVFVVADRSVDHVKLSDTGRTVVVIPKSETRPILAQQPTGESEFDYAYPESWGIVGLLESVHQQLPATGINVPLLGLEDRYSFDDAEYALLGEPDISGKRSGGLFANATSSALSAVLAFSLTPFGMDGTPADTAVRLFHNSGAGVPLTKAIADRLQDALLNHAASMVGKARSLK